MPAFIKKVRSRSDRRGGHGDAGERSQTATLIASQSCKTNGRAISLQKVVFFGHFDGTNFGNESCLQSTLYHLHQRQPEAQVICICSDPQITADTYHIQALPFSGVFRKRWTPKGPMTRLARKIGLALKEPYQWTKCIRNLHGADIMVIPGTGLLTDAYGLRGWGPYGLLKWSLIAKASGCKVALLSVGAGPIQSIVGKWCIKLILSLADFRSYRDISSVRCLEKVGLARDDEAIFPDLAFSLPECMIPRCTRAEGNRPVVGLGVMDYSGAYHAGRPADPAFLEYLETLVESSGWLLARGYDIRLLSGDLVDSDARRAFRRLLEERLPAHDRDRIIDEPVASVRDVLSHIASTDFVLATRFHNIVFGFLCRKPVISISFHHKCESLMAMMGMSDYCLQMRGLRAEQLIDALRRLEANAHTLRHSIRSNLTALQETLDQQYDVLFQTTQQELRPAELITK
jgi:polysaccharide pyruvyl transferase WcaK-like protein